MSSLDYPAMPTQLLRTLDTLARNARRDASLTQRLPLLPRVICFVGVQLSGTLARATPDSFNRLNGVHRLFQHLDVVDVGRAHRDGERDATSFDHKMALRARFAPIRRILPGFSAPPTAATLAESSAARDQSIRSDCPRRSNKTRCNLCQTPASCHSFNRRQQVIPEPQPISGGRYSHGSPVARTKRMPRNTSRSGTRGRPPRSFSGAGGSKGLMTAQSSSVINCFAMPIILHGKPRFC